jgi:hypothetical protein
MKKKLLTETIVIGRCPYCCGRLDRIKEKTKIIYRCNQCGRDPYQP